MKPLLSIVIPVYNVEKYLAECLDSILSQINHDYTDVEIILVDDGSTDGSGELCDEYADKCKEIKVIHQNNRGLLEARRSGFKMAKGRYILSVDSDDLLAKDALFSISDVINKTNSDIIFFNISVMNGSSVKSYYKNVFTVNSGCDISKKQVLEAFFTYEVPVVISLCSKVFKRECLDINCDYSDFIMLSTGEDTLQTSEIISRASRFHYLNKNLYIYRLGSGMTSKFDPEFYKTFKKIFLKVRNVLNLINDAEYEKMYNEKIVSTGCRAITQCKMAKMSYSERKQYIRSIIEDDEFKKSLLELDLRKANIKRKYRILLYFVNIHAYPLLHVALKIARLQAMIPLIRFPLL